MVRREDGQKDDGLCVSPAETGAAAVNRRSFIKGAAVAGTGGALGVAATSRAVAKEEAAKKAAQPQIMTARFDLKRPPKLAEVHAVLDLMLKRGGCTTCGLGGVDVRLLAAGPVERVQKPASVNVPVEITVQPAGAER